MLYQIFMSYLSYAVVTAYTPGPNNILALDTVSKFGWKKGMPVLIGISAGFLSVMLLCAVGCFQLAKILPAMTDFLKYLGAAYLVVLAVKIFRSKPLEDGSTKKSSFWMGFALQFLNVKIILYAITIYTGYVLPVSQSLTYLICAAFFNTLVGISGTLVWASAGRILRNLISRHYLAFNTIMALVLLWNAIKLAL